MSGRFLINLRKASASSLQPTEFTASLSFARFGINSRRIGNIGEPLSIGETSEDEDRVSDATSGDLEGEDRDSQSISSES